MLINKIQINNIPALIWGPTSDKVYIFVHGKMGSKETARNFAPIAISKGYQVISFDLPEHGDRKNKDYPLMVWNGVKDLNEISTYAISNWKEVNLYGCSLGAYFSLLAYKDLPLKNVLFQCPVLNMENLISNMMTWFNVTEEGLKAEKEIQTPMGETLNWDYFTYVKEHPIEHWDFKTHILYPSEDNLTQKKIIDQFINTHSAKVTIIEGANHYFTEPHYLNQLDTWIKNNI